MKLKDKIKSYSFWVSLTSAIILILKILGNRFNFIVDETMVSDLFTALCSILVLLGIIVPPSQQTITSHNNIDLVKNNNTKEAIIVNQNLSQTNDKTIQEHPKEEQESIVSTNEIMPETFSAQNIIDEQVEPLESTEIITNELSEENHQNTLPEANFKDTFSIVRENFSGNIEEYIFELQEELRKTREGM